jgi:environmental stress-induced protein Ves
LADTDRDARFSVFPGAHRELVLLEGRGLRLSFADGETRELRAPHQSHRFSGDRRVVGAPLDGPTRQLNLIWRPEVAAAGVTFRSLTEPILLPADVDEECAVHVITGRAVVLGGRRPLQVRAGDTVLLGSDRVEGSCIEGDAELLMVTVTPGSGTARAMGS